MNETPKTSKNYINRAPSFQGMKHLKIKYDQQKCIGVGSCAKLAPGYFQLNNQKAVLKGAKKEGEHFILDVECTSEQYEKIIAAGEKCPVNVIEVIDQDTGKILVETEISLKGDLKEITAQYDDAKEFVMDDKGYFLIRVDHSKKLIEVGFCGALNRVSVKVVGKKPLEIYQTIIKEGLITRIDHAAYIGRELQKAYIALENNLKYVQDDELIIEKKEKQ